MFKRAVGLEIQELLGEGSQGRVYRALRRDPSTDLKQTVALKILHSEIEVKSWKDEFASLCRVRSPYCVQVYGFERIGNKPALVLEFVDGVSLSALGRSCWLSEDETTEILAQVEAAVLDLFRFGESHGDLSPQNILLDTDGRIRLLDFGAANACRATPAFAAPERLIGEPASLASDTFSIGRLEQFLKGNEPTPEPDSTYLQSEPSRRSLRGLNPCEIRRAGLAEKVRTYQHRKRLSYFERTRTQLNARSSRPGSRLLALCASILLASAAGAERRTLPLSSLRVRTHHWHEILLDGHSLGYSPLRIPLDPARAHTLEWRSEKGSGMRKLPARAGVAYDLTDRDFSH